MILGEKLHTFITFYIFKLRIRVDFLNPFQYIYIPKAKSIIKYEIAIKAQQNIEKAARFILR